MVEGLSYVPEFLRWSEERELVDWLESLSLRPVVMHGQESRRTVGMFGLDYDYANRALVPAEPWPAGVEWLRARAASLVSREPSELVQVLVSRYPPGAGI